jgi:pectin methylesterase-like acyl-CoA thioesterase
VQAALLRKAAGYYHDTYPNGDVIIRDTQTNIVAEFDDWDELTDEQKIFRGNVNAAIANVDRIRYELEMLIDSYDEADDVTRVRRALAEISL